MADDAWGKPCAGGCGRRVFPVQADDCGSQEGPWYCTECFHQHQEQEEPKTSDGRDRQVRGAGSDEPAQQAQVPASPNKQGAESGGNAADYATGPPSGDSEPPPPERDERANVATFFAAVRELCDEAEALEGQVEQEFGVSTDPGYGEGCKEAQRVEALLPQVRVAYEALTQELDEYRSGRRESERSQDIRHERDELMRQDNRAWRLIFPGGLDSPEAIKHLLDKLRQDAEQAEVALPSPDERAAIKRAMTALDYHFGRTEMVQTLSGFLARTEEKANE